MTSAIITVTFFMHWAADVSQSVLITQWPHYISSHPSGSAEMHCYQNDTDYEYLYWYRQLRGKGFQLMVTIIAGNANFEEGFKSGFEAVRPKEKQWSLTIPSVQEKDEAVYLCAASLHNNANEAYFGKGTKLTVLEKDRQATPPTVKVYKPPLKECTSVSQTLKDGKKKTLVCVASGFYPDHVRVSWKNGENITTIGVATDPNAVRDGYYYKITSRLRVSGDDWHKPGSEFTCIVTFFDGTKDKTFTAFVSGEAKDNDQKTVPTEQLSRIFQTAKVSYGVFIIKSSIYGAFVAFLVWKLQGSAIKQN
ncbi:M1-specific T cell receptor beta chain [Mastacembelus armatus]|uniref:M1-specific T cell receptor beta chain n=1 Tax=Mastacembelus armatus TaxID=205130 RepID=UPI000E453D7F|nr:M1-specific T cell receptor beta chain-like [Mastacembelus armatus]